MRIHCFAITSGAFLVILADTSVVIDALKKHEPAAGAISKYQAERIGISVLTVYEVKMGIALLQKQDPKFNAARRLHELDQFVKACDLFPVDSEVTSRGASIMADLILNGQVIDPIDVLIGSTCLCFGGSAILTQNKDHFDRIEGLTVVVP